ncbi:hypothetical protein Y032_0340g2997 [Ancylostoma ceylanicum]|uniref:Uncharacterized protein n=1 Tax=Ancylostoma ceylanicum TaxID=53326 RepID=A0A016RY55_9BILA|nr:hypothetical protein Y032_0340g2997 [Ancylostoma ceylanicum]
MELHRKGWSTEIRQKFTSIVAETKQPMPFVHNFNMIHRKTITSVRFTSSFVGVYNRGPGCITEITQGKCVNGK